MSYHTFLFVAFGVFVLFVLSILGIQKRGYLKHKVITILLTILTLCVTAFIAFLFYNEYNAYNQRLERYTVKKKDFYNKETENPITNQELNKLEKIQYYKNSLNGYEPFFKSLAITSNTSGVSYYNELRDNIITQLENQEYSQEYWDIAFNLIFKKEEQSLQYKAKNYEAIHFIPSTYFYRNLDENYGDLKDENNLSWFKTLAQSDYLQNKIKLFDRSKDNVELLWQQNKAFIYTFFSKSKYDNLCKQVVEDLITVHDTIVATPNYKTFYLEHDISDTLFLSFPSTTFTKKYNNSWLFSFWDRRFEEQNSEIIYHILSQVKQHYK